MKLHSLDQVGFRHDDPEVLFQVLSAIGLHTGPGTAEYELNRLTAAGAGFSVAAVDTALDTTELNRQDRITFKLALSNKGLLKGVLVP